MKKNLLWMAAAIMTCGLAFTSCAEKDLPAGPAPVDPEANWNKETSVIDFEDGKAVFTATSRMSVEVKDDAEKESKVLALVNAKNTQNGYGFAYYNFADKVKNPTNITIKFDYFNGGGRGCMTIGDGVVRGTDGVGAGMDRINKAPFYGAKGAILAVGATTDGKNYFVNDQILGAAADWCNKWLTVEVTVYTLDRQVEWKITDLAGEEILAQSGTTEGEGEDAVFTPGKIDYWQADADECTQIDCFGFVNNNVSYIDNLSVTNAQDPEDKYADDVKIMFVDHEGNELKAAKVISARVGTIVKLAEADKASFYNADESKKYIFAFDNAQYNPVAEKGTVIKAVFREAETCYAVLNCVIDGTTTTLYRFYDTEKYTFLEGASYTIHPSRCYGKDGAYYVTKATDWNGVQFTFPGTIAPTISNGKIVYIGTLNYELDESIVYFANFEDLALPTKDAGYGTGLGQLEGTVTNWWNWTNDYWTRFDGGRSINLGADSYVWTEPIAEAGTYNVVIYGRNNIYYGGEGYEIPNPYKLGLRDAAGKVTYLDVEVPAWGSSATGESVIEGVEIPAGSSIVVYNDGAKVTANDGTELEKDLSFDDIKVVKPAAAE
jgi:hypothetical protein